MAFGPSQQRDRAFEVTEEVRINLLRFPEAEHEQKLTSQNRGLMRLLVFKGAADAIKGSTGLRYNDQ